MTDTPDGRPEARLDPRYSSPGAVAADWPRARAELARAEHFWISTVRPDGRPHVTPLHAVWDRGALHFSTGAEERKARNLAVNPEVVLTTGSSSWTSGRDLVVEGRAVRVRDRERLRELARAWAAKYGPAWHFELHGDDAFEGGNGPAYVFAVEPRTAFAFGKGEPYSQTRWRFGG